MAKTRFNIEYPSPTDQIQPDAISNLAVSVDNALGGQTSSLSGVFTPASGWDMYGTESSAAVFALGPLRILNIALVRTGAAIPSGTGGDITPDPLIGTLAAGWIPVAARATAALDVSGVYGGTVTAIGAASPDATPGHVLLRSLNNASAQINTGRNCFFTLIYTADQA